MTTVGSITHIKIDAEPDGSHMLMVADFGEQPFEVLIPVSQIGELINTLQSNVLKRAQEMGQNAQLPMLTAKSIGLAHQGQETALMVSTNQMGSVVLLASDDVLLKLRSEIDRVLTFRSGPATKQ